MKSRAHGWALVAAALASLALAACSSAAASGPPSARSLIMRVPGCSKPFTPSGGVAASATGELQCDASSAIVDVATFTSAGLARSWLVTQAAGGTCVSLQGSGWAAVMLPTIIGSDTCGLAARLARVLGGRVVSP